MARKQAFELAITEDYEQMSRCAAAWLGEQIEQKPDLLMCLATGSSPRRLYELLVDKRRSGHVKSERLRVIKLDEWGGMPMDDPRTCEWFVQEHFLQPMGIDAGRYQGFWSDAPDAENECRRVGQWVQDSGPINLCVLGLGTNGHLGLNEPATTLHPYAHVAQLTVETLGHGMLKGGQTPPTYGLTLGMAEILQSRQILLLVNGPHKAEQMRRLMTQQIACDFPASMLWTHPRVVCFCDREAAELLP